MSFTFWVSLQSLLSIFLSFGFKKITDRKLLEIMAKKGYVINFETVKSLTIYGPLIDRIPFSESTILSIPILNEIYIISMLYECQYEDVIDEVIELYKMNNWVSKMDENQLKEFLSSPTYKNAIKQAQIVFEQRNSNGDGKSFYIKIQDNATKEFSYIYYRFDKDDLILEEITGPFSKYDDDLIIKLLTSVLFDIPFSASKEELELSERKQSLTNLHDALIALKNTKQENSQRTLKK